MYNSKKRLGITVLIWVVLVILTALALWSTELNADTGVIQYRASNAGVKVGLISWFTTEGRPHDIFIVDRAYFAVVGKIVKIYGHDGTDTAQILMGGMFDIEIFDYGEVFDSEGVLRKKFVALVRNFKFWKSAP